MAVERGRVVAVGLGGYSQSHEGNFTNFIAEHQGSIARLSCERELCTSGFEFPVGWWVKIQGGAGGGSCGVKSVFQDWKEMETHVYFLFSLLDFRMLNPTNNYISSSWPSNTALLFRALVQGWGQQGI